VFQAEPIHTACRKAQHYNCKTVDQSVEHMTI
jgi:hypothetical protein